MGDNEVAALRALTGGDLPGAREALASGVTRPLLNAALGTYLAGAGDGEVYDRPAAFTAFIRGGGNVGLYEAVSTALAELYDRHDVTTLLDIGCGDGQALVPAIAGRTPAVTLVEPSRALLDAAVAALDRVPVTAHNTDVATFAESVTDRFDLAESTFALHALPHGERSAVLTTLHGHVSRLVLAEFDVPGHPVGSAAHLTFLADTYEQGLAEYESDRDLVAQGFLMPVLTGQLEPGAHRSTWEQPATAWAEQVRSCGYDEVMLEPVYHYWSAPAFLLTARGGA
ncbi:methyltransferase domain-containing protein [Actinophytocola glycyrrhizae]|uniref:Methyltransferase domain-containing protein n=1 Tax=Actinophytocola glycyrrhizae TaxID=2044873 RepID=A0ABV9RUS5_9PSEU